MRRLQAQWHCCDLQNRFIAFDKPFLRPGAHFETGRRFFEPLSTHNIPGYPDNMKVQVVPYFSCLHWNVTNPEGFVTAHHCLAVSIKG